MQCLRHLPGVHVLLLKVNSPKGLHCFSTHRTSWLDRTFCRTFYLFFAVLTKTEMTARLAHPPFRYRHADRAIHQFIWVALKLRFGRMFSFNRGSFFRSARKLNCTWLLRTNTIAWPANCHVFRRGRWRRKRRRWPASCHVFSTCT